MAFDDRATQHKVTPINRYTIGCGQGFLDDKCTFVEDIGIEISDEQMQAFAKGGVEFKVKPRYGTDTIISLEPELFATQFAALNPYVASRYTVDASQIPSAPLGARMNDHGGRDGVQLTVIQDGSVAAKSGLKSGDRLLELDGVPLKTEAQAKAIFDHAHYGSTINATVRHGDQTSIVALQF
jgi:S1-C subfamily serine protease